MKSMIPVFLAASLVIMLGSCFHNNHDISISVKETRDVYRFTASFPEKMTGKIQALIDKETAPNSIFNGTEDFVDLNTTLPDQTQFSIKASPGELSVKLDRYENNRASYLRIKRLCEEIKNSLKD